MYVQFPSVGSIIDDPLFGAVVMEKLEPSVNPSTSVAFRSPVMAESSLRDLDVSPENRWIIDWVYGKIYGYRIIVFTIRYHD